MALPRRDDDPTFALAFARFQLARTLVELPADGGRDPSRGDGKNDPDAARLEAWLLAARAPLSSIPRPAGAASTTSRSRYAPEEAYPRTAVHPRCNLPAGCHCPGPAPEVGDQFCRP